MMGKLPIQLPFPGEKSNGSRDAAWWRGDSWTDVPSFHANSHVPNIQLASTLALGSGQAQLVAGRQVLRVERGAQAACQARCPHACRAGRLTWSLWLYRSRGIWLSGCSVLIPGLYPSGSCVLPSSFFSERIIESQSKENF